MGQGFYCFGSRKGVFTMAMTKNATLLFQLSAGREALPVPGAGVTLTSRETGRRVSFVTDLSGRTPPIPVCAPPRWESLDPNFEGVPYSLYDARVEAEGYIPVTVRGIQVFPGEGSVVPLSLDPQPMGRDRSEEEVFDIPENGLLTTTERQPEGPDPQDDIPQGRVLTNVYIPRYITVHLGAPSNASAQNVTVDFAYYIKNVASSEIYPTWPENAIRANIYAQISFALNRIFTEWYPSRGYSFNITNHTGYDQYYVPGRNIFTNIGRIVDEIFTTYIRRPGALNPLFAEYCNGTTVSCDGLSQWGTVSLAQQGYTPLSILRRFYGSVELIQASQVRNIESSYPGSSLSLGSRGAAVQTIQRQLSRIRRNYPAIPALDIDGIFGSGTRAAVMAFQRIFNLTQDGIVGRGTWNRISNIYVAVTRLAELDGENEPLPDVRPSNLLRQGDRGETVRLAQYFLRVISNYYNSVRPIAVDGIFGSGTKNAVIDFQRRFGLSPDGIIGPATWNSLYNVFMGIANTSGLVVPYPGTLLREGSRGDNVQLMQEYLRTIGTRYPIPWLAIDGIFGPATRDAVLAFQRLAGIAADGIIGRNTWDRIVATRLLI